MINNFENKENDEISFKIFTILFDLYLFGKKIEKSKLDPMILDEYFLINLEWLKIFKEKFAFKELEKILDLNCGYDHTHTFHQKTKKDKFREIFDKLKNECNYHLTATETDFKSVKIIINSKIEKIEQDYVAQRNFAIVDSKIIMSLKENGFIFDVIPKYDIYIGNENIVFENTNDKYCLQCIISKDYDSFTREYIIKFDNDKNLTEQRDFIISNSIEYYFNQNKIKKDGINKQNIINCGQRIAIVYNLDNQLEEEQSQLRQTKFQFFQNRFGKQNQDKNKFNNLNNNGNQNGNEINKNGSINFNQINNYNEGKNIVILNSSECKSINYKKDVFKNIVIKDCGLKNFSNSCYINAVLQCLIHTYQIAKYFLLNNDHINMNSEQMYLAYSFNNLLKYFYVSNNNMANYNEDLINTLLFLCKIINIMSKKNFSPLIPNDAKDFLIFFIGRLHEELNEVDRATYDVVPEKDPLSNFISYFTKNYNSIISNLFNWTNQIKRKCSGCKSQIFSYQTFPYLILDLEKTRKKIFYSEMDKYHKSKLVDNNWRDEYYHNKENIPINLIDCVAYYCSYENQFNFLCPMCNTECQQTTVNKIYLSPNIFIFILNRGKNNVFSVKMDYPDELDLSQYVESNKGNTKYQLTGVITHLGVSGPNGHFLAFCKNPLNGKWFKYNDEKITDASNYEVHNEGVAYILFYNIIKPKHQK